MAEGALDHFENSLSEPYQSAFAIGRGVGRDIKATFSRGSKMEPTAKIEAKDPMSQVADKQEEELKASGGGQGLAHLEHHPGLQQAGSSGVHTRTYRKTFFLQTDNTQMEHIMWSELLSAGPPNAFSCWHILPGVDLPLNYIGFYIDRGEMISIREQNQAFRYGTARSRISNITMRTEVATGTGDMQLASHHINMPDCFVYEKKHSGNIMWKSFSTATGINTPKTTITTNTTGPGFLVGETLEGTLYGQLSTGLSGGNPANRFLTNALVTSGGLLANSNFPTLLSAETRYTPWLYRAAEPYYEYQTNDLIKPNIHGESCADGACWDFEPIVSDGRWRQFRAAEMYQWDPTGNTNQTTGFFPPEGVSDFSPLGAPKNSVIFSSMQQAMQDNVCYANAYEPDLHVFNGSQDPQSNPTNEGLITRFNNPMHWSSQHDPGMHIVGYMVPQNTILAPLPIIMTFRLDTEITVHCHAMINPHGRPSQRFFQPNIDGGTLAAIRSRFTLPTAPFPHIKRYYRNNPQGIPQGAPFLTPTNTYTRQLTGRNIDSDGNFFLQSAMTPAGGTITLLAEGEEEGETLSPQRTASIEHPAVKRTRTHIHH